MDTSERIISADSHVGEPPDLWTTRIDPKYRAAAPRLVHERQSDFWLVEGIPPSPAGLMISVGRASEELSKGRRYTDAPPGAADPDARLREIAIDGISAEVIYPTV